MKSYSTLSKGLHWSIALIVILMLSFSFFLDDVPSAWKGQAYMIHKSFGLTVLGLMLIRIFWISRRGRPTLPASIALWERVLARVVQGFLYIFLLIMPLSGWVLSVAEGRIPVYFGLFHMPLPFITANQVLGEQMDNVHKVVAWVIIGLLVFHVAGAIKNHVWLRNNVLRSMLWYRL